MSMSLTTILEYLKSIFDADSNISNYVRWIYVGGDIIDYLVSVKRYPFIVVDRVDGAGEEYAFADIGGLHEHHFMVSVKIGVRKRQKETALTGDNGLIELSDDVMRVIFADQTLNHQVHDLSDTITINEATILTPQGSYVGLGREIVLDYMITE